MPPPLTVKGRERGRLPAVSSAHRNKMAAPPSGTVCTINRPEHDHLLVIQGEAFASHSWVISADRLQGCLWLCAYRTAHDAAPFLIGLIDHARCRKDERGRWVIVGRVLARRQPHLELPGLCAPFPHNGRNPCVRGPPLDDAALVAHGLPSVAETLGRVGRLPLREFVSAEVADELRRRLELLAGTHAARYGARASNDPPGIEEEMNVRPHREQSAPLPPG